MFTRVAGILSACMLGYLVGIWEDDKVWTICFHVLPDCGRALDELLSITCGRYLDIPWLVGAFVTIGFRPLGVVWFLFG